MSEQPVNSEVNLNTAPSESPVTTSSDWLGTLPEDLRTDPTLSSIKDVQTLAKGYVSAQRMLGGRIPIPSQEASEEVRNEFYAKLASVPNVVRLPDEDSKDYETTLGEVYDRLGRPKDPSGYKLELPEGLDVDENYVKSMAVLSHKAGLTNKQFKALAEHELQRGFEMQSQAEKAQKQSVEFLNKTWGNKFNENMSLAKNVVNKYAQAYPEATQEIINGPAGNNPVVLMMLAEMGKLYQQEGTLAINNGTSGARTPEEAKSLIADVLGNAKHPYHDKSNPAHNDAVRKMEGLYKDAFPQPAKDVDGLF